MPDDPQKSECFFCFKENRTCPIYPQNSNVGCVEFKKIKISEMSLEQLREEFGELSRDQLLLTIQTREQWRERVYEAKKAFAASEHQLYAGMEALKSM